MSEQQTDPAATALAEIDASGGLMAGGVSRLIAVAEVALRQHHRSLSPVCGSGSGDTHNKHYCAGLCHVSINHDTVWEPWPCFPYLAILAALTGTTVVDLTFRDLAEHTSTCLDCLVAGGNLLDGASCPRRPELAARWRRALREAGRQQ